MTITYSSQKGRYETFEHAISSALSKAIDSRDIVGGFGFVREARRQLLKLIEDSPPRYIMANEQKIDFLRTKIDTTSAKIINYTGLLA